VAPGAGPGAAAVTVAAALEAEEEPFYWYRDTKVFLEAVPGEFVVRTGAPDPAAVAREALAGSGREVAAGRRLIRGHRIPRVPGAGREEARAVARQLHAHGAIGFAAPRYVHRESGAPFVPLGTFTARFGEGVSPSEIEALNAEHGVTVVRAPEPGKRWQVHHLRYPSGGDRSVLAIAAVYDRHPLTEWADPTRLVRLRFAGVGSPVAGGDGTSQEFFGDQWYLRNPFQEQDGVPLDINVVPAWNGGQTGAGVKVAVLDSGVDGDHEDLGFVGDGGDFYESDECEDPQSPDCDPNGATNPAQGDVHGTAVAGIIAAEHQTDNTGVAGIAPGVDVISIRVGIFGVPDDLAQTDSLAAAIHSAWYDFDADVINGSWGTGTDPVPAISDALEWAVKDGRNFKGTVSVFAAGNDSLELEIAFPASDPNAIAVSGLARSTGESGLGGLHPASNSGFQIEVAAFWGDGSGACGGEIVTTNWRSTPISRSTRCGLGSRTTPTGERPVSGGTRPNSGPAS